MATSSLEKTSTRRQGSSFSNSKEDVKEISALRQKFEDVKDDKEALKKLTYEMVEAAFLGEHVKVDVCDVIEEFEHGKVLGVIDNNTKKLIKTWAQKGMKHFVENPELENLLTTWGNAYVQEERVSVTKDAIKKKGCLIPLEGVLQMNRTSLTNYIHFWNSKPKQGLKCKYFFLKYTYAESFRLADPGQGKIRK